MTALSERTNATRVNGVRASDRVRLREQVRVAVLFNGRQTDMALPATETVATLATDVLRELQPGQALRGPDGRDMIAPGKVVLKTVGGTVLNRGQSLSDQGVIDGDLLVLDVEDAEVTFTPVIENASSAIAQFNAARFSSVTPQTALQFSGVAAGLGSVVAVGLLVNAWRLDQAATQRAPLPALVPALVAVGLSAVLLAGAALVWWRRRATVVANGLWMGAVIAASTAAFIAVPGKPGAWHVVFAAAIAAMLAMLLWRLSPAPRGVVSWLALVGGGVFGIAASHGIGIQMTYLWIGALFVALLVLKSTESLAQLLARVPMPPFPTVTGKLVFDDAEEIAAEALVAAETEGTPSVAELEYAAAAANTYQQAIVAATAPFFIVGAAGAVTVGQGRWWLSTIYVLTLAAILVFRGRSFDDRATALIVVSTAFAMTTALALKYALGSHDSRMSLVIAAVVLALGLSAVLVAAVVPRRVFSAPFRKGVEWLDYGMQVLIPPLVFWLLNLYFLTRNAL
ncbi:type VII secretion integral membrane protein EccD [Mycobacterium riyadhense]|uniref:type VII secretion integral membrane protein EccD n=1 Tax=Mycobacterium riyadhense TaxID=486698 RepID=UPI001951E284|nr:type VII secretion integral membrane protein EccD [Mycobacterium riyadhense]